MRRREQCFFRNYFSFHDKTKVVCTRPLIATSSNKLLILRLSCNSGLYITFNTVTYKNYYCYVYKLSLFNKYFIFLNINRFFFVHNNNNFYTEKIPWSLKFTFLQFWSPTFTHFQYWSPSSFFLSHQVLSSIDLSLTNRTTRKKRIHPKHTQN